MTRCVRLRLACVLAMQAMFSKATSLDDNFAPAWLSFGHAFAAQDESDQVGMPVLCTAVKP